MKGTKKLWLIVLLLLAVLAAALLLHRPDSAAAYAQTQVTTGNIQTTYSFTGSIVAPRTQTALAAAGGVVKEIYVETNQMVEEGDRLMKLSSGETVRAEIDGEVVSLSVEKDDTVAPGAPLITVIDISRLEAEISVDEYDAEAIEPGKPVQVSVNALDTTCEGTVKSFSKQGMVVGTMAAYSASVVFDVPEKALPGMQVEVQMLNQSAENALLLKVAALQFDEENRAYALVKDGDEYVRAYVETGINDGSTVQILSGLTNGQTVYYTAGIDIMAMMEAMRGGR